LIKDSLRVNVKGVVEKIKSSSLIKKDLNNLIKENLEKLENNKFFESDEKIEDFVISEYNLKGFENFKENIKPLLVEICKGFLKQNI